MLKLKESKTIQNQLRIMVDDLVNGGEILVAQAYITIEKDKAAIFNYDIWNPTVFNNNKDMYLEEIENFKVRCEEEATVNGISLLEKGKLKEAGKAIGENGEEYIIMKRV